MAWLYTVVRHSVATDELKEIGGTVEEQVWTCWSRHTWRTWPVTCPISNAEYCSYFKEVREELVMAINDFIPTREDSMWQSLRRSTYNSQGTQVGSRSLFKRSFNAWFAAPRNTTNRIFVGALLCSWSFSRSTIPPGGCAELFFRPGLRQSDFEFDFRGQ